MLLLLCPMMYLKATSWKRIDWRRNKSEFVLLPLPNAEWNKEGGHDRSSYFGTNPAHFISIIFFNRLPFIFLIEFPSSFHGQQKGTSPTMPTANVAKKGAGEFHQFLVWFISHRLLSSLLWYFNEIFSTIPMVYTVPISSPTANKRKKVMAYNSFSLPDTLIHLFSFFNKIIAQ